MKKAGLLVLASLLAALLMVPSLTSAAEPKYGGTLTLAAEADIVQTDPHRTVTMIDGCVMQLVCESLVETDRNYKNLPGLAHSWDVSDDGLTWNFYLRKGVLFHNGREMTAEDVKWNFDRFMDPDLGSMLTTRYQDMLDSTEVVDKYTVRFNLKRPSGAFLASFGGSTVRTTIIAKECVNEDGSITNPIGTGPYKFVEWKPNDYWKYSKFDDYWQEGLPYLDTIIMKPVIDENVRHIALKTGDVDMAMMLPEEEAAEGIENPPKGVVYSMFPLAGTCGIMFNPARAPWSDKRVRQAVAYAINKDEIMLGTSFGYGEVTNQQFTERTGWNPGVPDRKQDIAKAKALMAEAGYPDGFSDVMPVTSTYRVLKDAAQIIQAQVAEIGIKLELEVLDWGAWIALATKVEYGISNCGMSQFSDPDLLYPSFWPKASAFNWFMGNAYDNPEVDALIAEAGALTDQGERLALYKKMVEIVNEDVPFYYYGCHTAPMGWRDYVKGFDAHMASHYNWADGGLMYTWLDK